MRLLYDSPQLSPHLNVLLKRCDGQSDIILFNHGDVSAPLKKSEIFLSIDLLSCHLLWPLWSSRYFQELILGVLDTWIGDQESAHELSLRWGALRGTLQHLFLVNNGDLLLCCEGLIRELSELYELLNWILIDYGEDFGFLWDNVSCVLVQFSRLYLLSQMFLLLLFNQSLS